MKRDEIEKKVFEIVVESLKIERAGLTLDSSFEKGLKADSLDIVNMIMDIEHEFELVILGVDAEKLKTIGNIVDYVVKKKGRAET